MRKGTMRNGNKLKGIHVLRPSIWSVVFVRVVRVVIIVIINLTTCQNNNKNGMTTDDRMIQIHWFAVRFACLRLVVWLCPICSGKYVKRSSSSDCVLVSSRRFFLRTPNAHSKKKTQVNRIDAKEDKTTRTEKKKQWRKKSASNNNHNHHNCTIFIYLFCIHLTEEHRETKVTMFFLKYAS